MPRLSRICPVGWPVHVIQRGNNRRFRSSIVQSRRYVLACQRYIELNPVRAGLVNDPADYSWSSYRMHALGCHVKMWNPHGEYLALGSQTSTRSKAYRELFNRELDQGLISEIRLAANVGLALGNEEFKEEVERLTGQRQHHLKRGPKPKSESHPGKEFLL